MSVQTPPRPLGEGSEQKRVGLLDAKQAGELLGVPHTWMLREARAKRVPHRNVGRYVRWSMDDIEWIIESMADGPRVGSRPAQTGRNSR